MSRTGRVFGGKCSMYSNMPKLSGGTCCRCCCCCCFNNFNVGRQQQYHRCIYLSTHCPFVTRILMRACMMGRFLCARQLGRHAFPREMTHPHIDTYPQCYSQQTGNTATTAVLASVEFRYEGGRTNCLIIPRAPTTG